MKGQAVSSNEITANQRLKAQSMESILDAAGQCYLENGFSGTTVDDIAERARVGRATVFRNFNTKEAIFTEYVQRECRQIIARSVSQLEKAKTPEEYLTTLFLLTICDGPKEPIHKITTADYHSRAYSFELSFLSSAADQLLEQTFPPFFAMAKKNGQVRRSVNQADMIQWIKRLNISFVLNPIEYDDDPKKVRKFLSTFVVPSFFRDPD